MLFIDQQAVTIFLHAGFPAFQLRCYCSQWVGVRRNLKAQGEVVLHRDKIVSVLQTNKETTKAYTAATSGIIAPEKKGLIT